MKKVVKAFGFATDICKWIDLFDKDSKSTVTINGRVSKWFSDKQGCRQGGPSSPYLFILCVEILGIMIRENKSIKGIVVNENEYKILQYADDTEFTLNGDQNSFESCLEVLDRFGNKSGLKLNVDKCSALWLGSKRNSNVRFLQHLNIKWNPYKIKIWGIWFQINLDNMIDTNYNDCFYEKLKLFRIWSKELLPPWFNRCFICRQEKDYYTQQYI